VKYVSYILILFLMVLIIAGHWINFPLSIGWGALSLKPLHYTPGGPHRTIASYGLLVALALVPAAEAYRRDKWKLMYYMGALLLAVAISAWLQIALATPRLLYYGLSEASWQQAAVNFTRQYLPLNPQIEPTVLSPISFVMISGRLFSAWYLLGPGWYLAVIVALAVMIAGARGLDARTNLQAAITTCVLLALLVTAFSWRPLMGEHALAIAAREEGQEHLERAEQFYRRAIQLDGWNALDLEIYQRIGALDIALGRTGSAESRIYQAEFDLEQGKMPEAIAEYEAILATPGPLNAVVQDRVVQLWADYGLSLYETGAYGSAVDAWKHALVYYPDNWLCVFYLTRGYFAVGRYQEAINVASNCLERVADPEFIGNLYSNLGDAQTRLRNFGAGHRSYILGYDKVDYILNWRAIVSLIGE
jgi:tetratricopeptide (TPR) repeat protein